MKPRNPFGFLISATLAAALLAPAARAEEEPPQPAPVQRFQFTDDEIQAGLTGPEGEPLEGMPPTQHRSLIEIRDHFLPEMLKSLEDM